MIKLRHGNCMDILGKMDTGSVDLIVMDPPYKQDGGAGAGSFGGSQRGYYTQLSSMSEGISQDVLKECIRVLKRINIYIYCNKAQLKFYLDFFSSYPVSFNLLCWHKTNPIPATHNIYLRDTEYILFFRERGVPLYGSYETKHTYFITPVNKKDKKEWGHPTIKPIEQARIFIQNSSSEGDVILDPYMGTGTTGVAAVSLERSFIGVEKDSHWYSVAKNRIRTARDKKR